MNILFRQPDVRLAVADNGMRSAIYKARHDVYACELRQYPVSPDKVLTDATDAYNHYIVATVGNKVAGFVAVTPPGKPKAMEKHSIRTNTESYEVRLLTVLKKHRGRGLGSALMYGALRFVEASGGTRIDAVARLEVLPMYQAVGLVKVSDAVHTVGQIQYVHVGADCADLRATFGSKRPKCTWDLPVGMEPHNACVHGGKGLERLDVDPESINADVLDAWFPPPPDALDSVTLSALHRTPPALATDLVHVLAEVRGVPHQSLVLGAGSSDLIYRAFFAWLTPASRVLLVTPTYTEYEHILKVIECSVTACTVGDIPHGEFDLAIFVNPNSPTGVYTPQLPTIRSKRVWVDETYIDYLDSELSLEKQVMTRTDLIVCKSMSKAYALSGLRVGYLCSHPINLEAIRKRTPPWIVSRVAQMVGVKALRSPSYYKQRYAETADLRQQLTTGLQRIGWHVFQGSVANFILCRPPFLVSPFLRFAAHASIYLRKIDDATIRIAVTDLSGMDRILELATLYTTLAPKTCE